MGAAIATRILQSGFNLTVYNRTLSKTSPLENLGATVADTLPRAVKNADLVITCLFDDASVLDVLEGADGILNHMKKNSIHAGTSTILPSTAKKIQNMHSEHDSIYISANVLGGPRVAIAGKLIMFCSGDHNAIIRCKPVFATFSEEVMDLGQNISDAGKAKICSNYCAASSFELIAELYAFAEKTDLDLEIIQGILHSVYAHPGIKGCIDKIKNRSFDDVNFSVKGGAKDIDVYQKTFLDAGVTPEIANILQSRYKEAIKQGLGDKDWSSIYEVVRKKANLE